MKTVALDMLKENYKHGKINPTILKALFKVVIDDTYYEISGVMQYIDYLKEQVKRLETIQKYDEKRLDSKKEKDQAYYLEGMKILFESGETVDNYKQVLKEYLQAIVDRETHKQKLYDEIKIIKKLRV